VSMSSSRFAPQGSLVLADLIFFFFYFVLDPGSISKEPTLLWFKDETTATF
jgi:hypothetical protein